MKSYTSTKSGFARRARELSKLYKFHTRDLQRQVDEFLSGAEDTARTIEAALGGPLRDRDILEIGPGQKKAHLYYFGRNNRYTGIDLDLPVDRLTPLAVWQIFRANGAVRAAKTVGRKALGIDSRFKSELARRLDLKNLSVRLQHMDAAQLEFDDASFDLTYSVSVFEHLPDFRAVARQIGRVLRPGGVAYHVTHLYTSDTGIHDPRLYGDRDDIPYWAHLRPQYSHLVEPNCYLNRLRLDDYRTAFQEIWPDVRIVYAQNDERARAALKELRAQGELPDYTDEELLTDVIVTIWKKPAASSPLDPGI